MGRGAIFANYDDARKQEKLNEVSYCTLQYFCNISEYFAVLYFLVHCYRRVNGTKSGTNELIAFLLIYSHRVGQAEKITLHWDFYNTKVPDFIPNSLLHERAETC